jgi:hypothetical protein
MAGDDKPTPEQIATSVVHILAGFTHMKPDQIDPAFALRDPPLALDDSDLGFLAMTLRGFVQKSNPGATVTAADTRKPGLTVKGLIDLVVHRIGQ